MHFNPHSKAELPHGDFTQSRLCPAVRLPGSGAIGKMVLPCRREFQLKVKLCFPASSGANLEFKRAIRWMWELKANALC